MDEHVVDLREGHRRACRVPARPDVLVLAVRPAHDLERRLAAQRVEVRVDDEDELALDPGPAGRVGHAIAVRHAHLGRGRVDRALQHRAAAGGDPVGRPEEGTRVDERQEVAAGLRAPGRLQPRHQEVPALHAEQPLRVARPLREHHDQRLAARRRAHERLDDLGALFGAVGRDHELVLEVDVLACRLDRAQDRVMHRRLALGRERERLVRVRGGRPVERPGDLDDVVARAGRSGRGSASPDRRAPA